MEDWKTEEGLDETPKLGCFKSNEKDCSSCVLFNKVLNTLAKMIFENKFAESFLFLGYWDIKLKEKIGMECGSILNALIEGSPSEQKDMLKSVLKQLYGEDTINQMSPMTVLAIPKHMMN